MQKRDFCVSKKVRLHQIAQLCQCSPSTVSRALKNHPSISAEVVGKIQQMARELGYRKKKDGDGSKRIALVTNSSTLWGEFEERMASQLEKAFQKCGLSLHQVVCRSGRQEVERMPVDGVCGIILYQGSSILGKQLSQADVPLVRIDPAESATDFHSVILDHQAGAFEAVDYLLRLGHRAIMMLAGPEANRAHCEKARGFEAALTAHGVSGDTCGILRVDDNAEDACQRLGQALDDAAGRRPTAVFAASDRIVLGAFKAIGDRRLSMPGDVSLIGFRDCEWMSFVTPEITTVEYPAPELAEATLDLLSRVMEKQSKGVFHSVIVKPRLIIRRSGTCREGSPAAAQAKPGKLPVVGSQ